MAAIDRPKAANYNVHEEYSVETQDHEDHTFCGIMFSLQIKANIPLEYVEIESISVRGYLGPLTVWVTQGHWNELSITPPSSSSQQADEESTNQQATTPNTLVKKYASREHWKCIYRAVHLPSPRRFVRLVFGESIRASAGDEISFYVHSELPNDRAIVYDNQHGMSGVSHEDKFMVVKTGQAHLCNEPFAEWHPWGSWRKRREFVGRIEYGCRFLLWNPESHQQFEASFRELVMILILAKPRADCPISWCSDDVLFYILNMCKYDWVPPKRQLTRSEKAALQLQQVKGELSGTVGTATRRLSGIFHRGVDMSRKLMNAVTI